MEHDAHRPRRPIPRASPPVQRGYCNPSPSTAPDHSPRPQHRLLQSPRAAPRSRNRLNCAGVLRCARSGRNAVTGLPPYGQSRRVYCRRMERYVARSRHNSLRDQPDHCVDQHQALPGQYQEAQPSSAPLLEGPRKAAASLYKNASWRNGVIRGRLHKSQASAPRPSRRCS